MVFDQDIDQIISNLPSDDLGAAAKAILLAIKDGLIWEDSELVSKFNEAPNALNSKSKAWLPRHIQEYIGKIEKIKAIVIQPRMPSARRKAIYKSLDIFVSEKGYYPLDHQIVDIYQIKCACGGTFLGREPEHQIKCKLCKSKKPTKQCDANTPEFIDQVKVMLLMVDNRNISESIKIKVFSRLKRKIAVWGHLDDDIIDLFVERGFTSEEFDEL